MKSLLLLSLLLGVSCASKQSTKKEPAKTPTRQTTTSPGTDCRSGSGFLSKYKLGLNESSQDTLCNLSLSEQQKTSFVVFVTSPTCESCKPILRDLNAYLTTKGTAKVFVAVPRRSGDTQNYSFSEVSTFSRTYAPAATPAIDIEGAMWLDFSADRSRPFFPIAVVFDKRGGSTTISTAELEQPNSVRNRLIPAIEKHAVVR